MVWAFVKVRHLLEGSDTTLVTDHAPIGEVLQSSAATQYSTRIDKFRMLLAPFLERISVHYRPGKEMTNVDPLSRATWAHTPQLANTEFITALHTALQAAIAR